MSKFFNSLNRHNKELCLVCCKHPLLSLRESHFAFIFKHHIPSTLSPSLSLEGLEIISTSGLEFQIVLWASSCHILLARAQFLLVQDNVRGGLTWTHWASELLTFFEPWVHETNKCINFEIPFFFLYFVSLSRKCKTHPGPVVHISGNPVDPNKVVELFSLWLKTQCKLHNFALLPHLYKQYNSKRSFHR